MKMKTNSAALLKGAFIMLSFSFVFSLKANIEILHITHDTNSKCNGAIELETTGTSGPFTITFSGPTTSETLEQVTGVNTFENLCAGNYIIMITNEFGCSYTLNTIVNNCPQLALPEPQANIPTACNTQNGSIIMGIPTNGTPPFSYAWNTGATSANLNSLATGIYEVTITDDIGCSTSKLFDLTLSGSEISVLSSIEHACRNTDNGSIDLAVHGNSESTFTFAWSNGESSEDLGNLFAGIYLVTITDQTSGCTRTYSAQVLTTEENDIPLSINGELSNSCSDSPSGRINLNISGGNPPYEIDWNNTPVRGSGWVVNYLAAGTYCVNVVDQCDNVQSSCFTIEESQLELNAYVHNECDLYNENGEIIYVGLGSINLNPQGDYSPYTIQWGHTSSSNTRQANLERGTYYVIVTDAAGCQKETAFDILPRGVPHMNTTITSASCSCCDDGKIAFTFERGIPPYTLHRFIGGQEIASYAGHTGVVLDGLTPGTYTFVLADVAGFDGCTSLFEDFVVPAENAIEISLADIQSHTSNGPGHIDIEVTGGQAPYSYSWSNGPTSQDIYHLSGGTYTVTVTDEYGCTETEVFEICQDADLIWGYSLPPDIKDYITPCYGGLPYGKIASPTPVGGTEPFTYKWSGPEGFTATTQDINHLSISGTYCVTITDACHEELIHCKELACDCNIWVRYDVDHCYKTNIVSIRVAAIGPHRNQSYDVYWPSGHSFPGGKSTVYVDDNGSIDENRSDPLEIQVDPPNSGTFTECITAVDYLGCLDYQCFPFANESDCLYELDASFPSNPNSSNIPQNTIPFDVILNDLQSTLGLNDFIGTCFKLDPCGSGDNRIQRGPIMYYPYDMSQPCRGGGVLKCELCADETTYTMEVPPNGASYQFENNGRCGCYFAPGLITDPNFYNAARYGISGAPLDPWSMPVVSFYNCNGPSNPPGGGTIIGPPQGPNCEDFTECDNCIFHPGQFCNYIIGCPDEDGGLSIVGETPENSNFYLCIERGDWLGEGDAHGFTIYEQCSTDPCNINPIQDCEEGCSHSIFDLIVAEHLQDPNNVAQCSSNTCIYSDAQQYFQNCLPCEYGPVVFEQPNDKVNQLTAPVVVDHTEDAKETLLEPKIQSPLSDFFSKVSPNPFINSFELYIYSQDIGEVQIDIFDILGRNIQSNLFMLDNSETTLLMNLQEQVSSGIYFISIQHSSGTQSIHRILKASN